MAGRDDMAGQRLNPQEQGLLLQIGGPGRSGQPHRLTQAIDLRGMLAGNHTFHDSNGHPQIFRVQLTEGLSDNSIADRPETLALTDGAARLEDLGIKFRWNFLRGGLIEAEIRKVLDGFGKQIEQTLAILRERTE